MSNAEKVLVTFHAMSPDDQLAVMANLVEVLKRRGSSIFGIDRLPLREIADIFARNGWEIEEYT